MIWTKIGMYNYVYVDKSGRIVGEYLESQFDGTTSAWYEEKKIGRYISESDAKAAIEDTHKNQIL